MSAGTQERSARADEIVAVSARLFRQDGYRDTSIRDIARALGIKSASLYYHFEKKDDILFAISYGLMEEFIAEVTAKLDGEPDPVAAIGLVAEAHLHFDFTHVDAVLVSARERRSLPAEMQRPINALRSRHRHALKKRIEEGASQGVFEVENASVAASAVLDLLSGVKEWYHPPRDGRHEGIVAGYRRFALALLGVR